MMTRVLIVTDAPMIAAGARVLAEATGECEVVGAVENAGALATALDRETPEVVLLDLDMAGDTAIPLLRRVRAQGAGAEVVGLSSDGDQHVLDALQAGARGYLSKRTSAEELKQAIATVRQGGMVLHPMAAASLLSRLQGTTESETEALTARESEVLRLLVEGLTNKAIAMRLSISEHTVKFHIGSILGKLGASSRTEAVRLAVRKGLVTL